MGGGGFILSGKGDSQGVHKKGVHRGSRKGGFTGGSQKGGSREPCVPPGHGPERCLSTTL